jgi:hypothetical protein
VQHAGRVQLAQQPQGVAKVVRLIGARNLHGAAFDPAACQGVPIRAQYARNSLRRKSGQMDQGALFAAQQITRQPARPGACGPGIADDAVTMAGNSAKDVGFQ